MSTIYECDGCGKQEKMVTGSKPYDWYAKSIFENEDAKFGELKGPLKRRIHACSRRCIESAAQKFQTHQVLLPI